MVSSTLCPAVHILGSQNVYTGAEGIADHYWPWAVFFFFPVFLFFFYFLFLFLFLLRLLLLLLLLLAPHLALGCCFLFSHQQIESGAAKRFEFDLS